MRLTIFVAPLFLVGFQQSRLQQRIQGTRRRTWGVRGSYAGVRGAYAVRGFDSHDFFEGRFFVGLSRISQLSRSR